MLGGRPFGPRGLVGRGLALLLLSFACLNCGLTKEEEPPTFAPESASNPPEDPVLRDLTHRWVATHPMTGRWSPAEPALGDSSALIAELEALGYVDGYDEATEAGGVLKHDKNKAFQGLNLLISGHAQEALLLDMSGEVLHRWVGDPAVLLPSLSVPPELARRGYFRRGWALEDGGFLGILEGLALVRLDRDSKPLWVYEGTTHHDATLAEDGSIYVLSREARYRDPNAKKDPYLHDTISHLSPDGAVIKVYDLYGAAARSDLGPSVRISRFAHDPLHTNTLELVGPELAKAHPEVKAGQLLVSFRSISALGIFDPVSEAMTWVRQGSFRLQHQPTAWGDGNILLFDNQREPSPSRVLALRLDNQDEQVIYGGSEAQYLWSSRWGSVQPLPNGNILISESERGRAHEITKDGEVVWSYLSPYRGGDKEQYIATLIEMVRMPPDYGRGWLALPPE